MQLTAATYPAKQLQCMVCDNRRLTILFILDLQTFIMSRSVLQAIITIMMYSNAVETTSFQMRYLMEFLFFGMYRDIGRALITKSIHCFCRQYSSQNSCYMQKTHVLQPQNYLFEFKPLLYWQEKIKICISLGCIFQGSSQLENPFEILCYKEPSIFFVKTGNASMQMLNSNCNRNRNCEFIQHHFERDSSEAFYRILQDHWFE